MEVYLDIILMENFIIDFFLLKLTCKVMQVNIITRRLFLAAGIGSVYTITFFIPEIKIFSTIPFQIVMSFFIMCVLFKNVGIKTKLKGVGVFILLSVLLSGMCFLLSMCQSKFDINTTFQIKENTLKNIILSLISLYLICDRVISYFRERALINNFTFDVEFELGSLKYLIRGFLDTGNELREPLTNLPCILVEEKFINNYQMIDNNTYLIPYSAIGVKGNIKGVKCEKVRIRKEGGQWTEIKAIICPCSEMLSRDNDFNALLSRGII